jgi:hypothetical protein
MGLRARENKTQQVTETGNEIKRQRPKAMDAILVLNHTCDCLWRDPAWRAAEASWTARGR